MLLARFYRFKLFSIGNDDEGGPGIPGIDRLLRTSARLASRPDRAIPVEGRSAQHRIAKLHDGQATYKSEILKHIIIA